MISISELYDLYLLHPEVSTDSRNVAAGSLFFALRGDRFDGNKYARAALDAGAAFAVVDDSETARKIGSRALLTKDSLATLQDLANYHRRKLSMPILAITGSNGKTTTKELIAAVMSRRYKIHATRGNFNNHIGVPLTLLQIRNDVEMAIIEMGANHQGEIAQLCRIAAPTHGMITNIGHAHLEGFGGPEGVKKGKGEMYDYLKANHGVIFVNLNAEHLPEMAAGVDRHIDYRSSESPSPSVVAMETKLVAALPNIKIAFLDEHGKLIEATTQLPGRHNFENIKAAVAIGKYFKVPGPEIAAALEHYLPENNRSQRKTHRGVHFWMDAYNANPSSVTASLSAFADSKEGGRVIILGEMMELGDASAAAHERIAQTASNDEAAEVILVGQQFAAAAKQLSLPYFPDVESLSDWFWARDYRGKTVLIKGSRSVGLEGLLK